MLLKHFHKTYNCPELIKINVSQKHTEDSSNGAIFI